MMRKHALRRFIFIAVATIFASGCGSSGGDSGGIAITAPILSMSVKDGDKLTGGVEITLDSQVTDANKSALTYLWQVSPLKGNLSAPTAASTKFTPPYVSKQEQLLVSLRVCNDGTKLCNQVYATILVQPSSNINNPPVINSISLASATLAGGSKNPITANVTDPDPGQTLTYTWSADRGSFGDTRTLETTYTAPVITQQSDVVNITLTVSDGFTTTSRTVAIPINNEPPKIQSIAIQNTVDRNSTTDITALVTPIGDTMTYLWSAQKGSFTSTKDVATKYKAPSTATTDTIRLTVCDARNSCVYQDKTITVK